MALTKNRQMKLLTGKNFLGILTNSTGIEGTAILASSMEKELRKVFDEKLLVDAKSFDKISL